VKVERTSESGGASSVLSQSVEIEVLGIELGALIDVRAERINERVNKGVWVLSSLYFKLIL
jgi:hypothetical protein